MSYARLVHEYYKDLNRFKNLGTTERSVKQDIENLLSYIEVAEQTIQRMCSDRYGIDSDEYCKAKNRLAIEGQQKVIAELQSQIDSLIQTCKAA